MTYPCIDLSLPASHFLSDVILKDASERCCRGYRANPAWKLRVPAYWCQFSFFKKKTLVWQTECVPANNLRIFTRPFDQIIATSEVEFILCSYHQSAIYSSRTMWISIPSIASHFMLFSGVTCPKFALMTAALFPDERRPWSVARPKYFFPWETNLALRPLPELVLVGLVISVFKVVGVTTVGVAVGTADPGRHWE